MVTEQQTTIYEVSIFYDIDGRHVVIEEWVNGKSEEVAHLATDREMNEHDWLERNGKSPWSAYRRITAHSDDEITIHVRFSVPVKRLTEQQMLDEAAASQRTEAGRKLAAADLDLGVDSDGVPF